MSISVSSVTKSYGEQKALKNVSFQVKPGEIVGFLGPNGAGKSTMMKIITGFIPQSSGKVEVCGMDISEKELLVKSKLGYLPENNPLYYEMYVKEYLEFVGGLYKVKNISSRVRELIEKVGLTKEMHKKIGALSKGYKQRVGLAQAFIHDPEVLILDEPTTGLDPNQILEIRDLIREIGKNKTVLLSTHIMQEVEAICDRAIIINEGNLIADEPVSSLKKAGAGKGKLLVEFSTAPDQKQLAEIFPKSSFQILDDCKYEFQDEDLSALRKRVMKFSVDQELEVVNMSEGSNNLEEVFRHLTKRN